MDIITRPQYLEKLMSNEDVNSVYDLITSIQVYVQKKKKTF